MAKEKVTLTLDAQNLAALRHLVGARSLSAAIDQAVAVHVARIKHLSAVDEWLAETERQHGPIPLETLEWAGKLVDDWSNSERVSSWARFGEAPSTQSTLSWSQSLIWRGAP